MKWFLENNVFHLQTIFYFDKLEKLYAVVKKKRNMSNIIINTGTLLEKRNFKHKYTISQYFFQKSDL